MSKVTVILPFKNAGVYIIDSIESIRAQEYPFKDIQLYLIDYGSIDISNLLAIEYSKRYNNIKYIKQYRKGISRAKNKGIELAKQNNTDFTFFIDAYNKYNKKHINICIDLLEQHPQCCFVFGMIRYFGEKDGLPERYNASFYKSLKEIESSDNFVEPYYIGHVSQGGWKTDILDNYLFNENFYLDDDTEFISRILVENKFMFSNEIEYLYRVYSESEINEFNNDNIYEKIKLIRESYIPLYNNMVKIRNHVPNFIQQTVIEKLYSLFSNKQNLKCNLRNEYIEISNLIGYILLNTNDDIIYSSHFNYWRIIFLYILKYGNPIISMKSLLPAFELHKSVEFDKGYRIGYLGDKPLYINIITEKEGVLKIRASMRCITYEHFKLEVISDYETDLFEIPDPLGNDKLFFCNMEIFPWKYYEIIINLKKPINSFNNIDGGYIRFMLTTDNGFSVAIKYDALSTSGLGYNMPFTLGDEYIIKRTKLNNALIVSPFSEREFINICSDIKPYSGIGEPDINSFNNFTILKNCIISNYRTLSNGHIWLFMDRINEIENNAEALFRYCLNKNDGIKKYYIIPDESYIDNFRGLPYIIFGSLEYKLACCFAEKFISSYLFEEGTTLRFGVNKKEKNEYENIRNFKMLVRSFFRGDIIHLQHGVIFQDISFYLNKYYEDTRLLFCISEKEYNYVKNELKDAINSDILRLTGHPKLDCLNNIISSDSQKVILFAPSFDKIHIKEGEYSKSYKNSEHYNYINSILNCTEMLDIIEEYGYKFYFKPHIKLYQQILDFEMDHRITIAANEISRYNLYTHSDLLITDYSGIAFDFSYLKRPVIYAHFVNNKFEETYFSYERDGFGEICNNMESLISTITGYIQNECKMSDYYLQRVNDFFTYQDSSNCERIYQEIINIPDTRKNIFIEEN